MQLTGLFKDDDAVSPVIGVILMVAITVILAAVIATFVLGLGDSVSDTSPQASFSTDWDGQSGGGVDTLTIKHSGGETLEGSNLYLRGEWDSGDSDGNWQSVHGGDTEVSAGSSVDVQIGPKGDIDIVWERTQGDKSATLGGWEGPDA